MRRDPSYGRPYKGLVTEDHDDPPNDRGALVLAPEPAKQPARVLLEVSDDKCYISANDPPMELFS